MRTPDPDDRPQRSSIKERVQKWLPLVPSLIVFLLAVSFFALSFRWSANGWTAGERAIQRDYGRTALIGAAFTVGAYLSINRASHKPSWRWAAWGFAAAALIFAISVRL